MTGFLVKMGALAAFTVASFATFDAQAQAVCGQRDDIVAQLQKKYGETRRSVGLQQGRGVVEIYASKDTGSWTILVTDTRGLSCLMAAGEAFQIEKIAEVETPA